MPTPLTNLLLSLGAHRDMPAWVWTRVLMVAGPGRQLARRFENVYRMRVEGIKYTADKLISLDSKIPKLQQLMRELSQAVMIKSSDLRLLVDKKPEGARSPNMADSVVMNYFPVKVPLVFTQDNLRVLAQGGTRR